MVETTMSTWITASHVSTDGTSQPPFFCIDAVYYRHLGK